MSVHSTDPAVARVQVGIDAAVVAEDHVTIRSTMTDGAVQLSRFHVPPTIAGLSRLGERPLLVPGCGCCRGTDVDDVVGLACRVAACRL